MKEKFSVCGGIGTDNGPMRVTGNVRGFVKCPREPSPPQRFKIPWRAIAFELGDVFARFVFVGGVVTTLYLLIRLAVQ